MQGKGYRRCYRCGKAIQGIKGTVFALPDEDNSQTHRWHLWCDDCYYRNAGDEPSMRDRNPYWIGLDRLRDQEAFEQATEHVREKSWHDPESWAQIGEALFPGADE